MEPTPSEPTPLGGNPVITPADEAAYERSMRGPRVMIAAVVLLGLAYGISFIAKDASMLVLLAIAGAFLLAIVGMIITIFEVLDRKKKATSGRSS